MERRPIWLLPMIYRIWAAGRARLFARWRLSWAGEDVQRGAEELAVALAVLQKEEMEEQETPTLQKLSEYYKFASPP